MLFRLKYIIITMCQLILFAGTYILDYFARNKLGMNRWLMYNSMQLEKKMPIFAIKIILSALILSVTSAIIFDFIKRRNAASKNKCSSISVFVVVVIALYTVLYFFLANTKIDKSYYLNAIIYIVIYLLQLVKIKLNK